MLYGLSAIFLMIIFVVIFLFGKKRKSMKSSSPIHYNRRRAFRLRFNHTFCDIQPLSSPSRYTGYIRDLSASGIRIETKLNTVSKGSLLLIFFELEEETFILEGMVKRKQIAANDQIQYGLKFINFSAQMQEKLYKKLWAMEQRHA